jgi:hypothetical protein
LVRNLNNSFVHGFTAYAAYASAPFTHSILSWVLAGLISIYAGWMRQAYLAAFLGGVIVAVVVLTGAGIFSAPGTPVAVLFMVPFALLLILPAALAGYAVGKIMFAIMHGRPKGAGSQS